MREIGAVLLVVFLAAQSVFSQSTTGWVTGSEGRFPLKLYREDGLYQHFLIKTSSRQIIIFGGEHFFHKNEAAWSMLKELDHNKHIFLYISQAGGGSVAHHKEFVARLRSKCPKHTGCRIHTYLGGSCVSACTHVYLSGDYRVASTSPTALLGFHRAFISAGPWQVKLGSPSMAASRYARIYGLNEEFIEEHADRLFNQPNNAVEYLHGRELLAGNFAHRLHNSLGGASHYLAKFHNLKMSDR